MKLTSNEKQAILKKIAGDLPTLTLRRGGPKTPQEAEDSSIVFGVRGLDDLFRKTDERLKGLIKPAPTRK